VIYVWKLVEAAYLTEPKSEVAVQEAPWSMLAPLWLLVIANVYFGVHTEVSVGLARRAATLLTGGGG
jgi:multicomponent Na+:H+ antiporter subunit D